MKRTVLLALTLTLATLALAAFTFAQPTPSIPHLINLQGRATDNVGNPVTDGAHTFTFRIFNISLAGAPLWTEGPLGIVTTGGLFTHQLGSSTPFPIGSFSYGMFQDETQLWLEIEVDGNIITPRTQLITTPYTQVANFVETDPVPGLGIVTVKIPDAATDCHIGTYGIGSLQKTQLGNCVWGQLLLWDPDPTQEVILQALGGGQLSLTDNAGTGAINLHGGLLGDASVVVPTDAVNAGEILDEPGIAGGHNTAILAVGVAPVNLESATITVPGPGYVVIFASAFDYPLHTVGTKDWTRYSISKTSATIDFSYFTGVSVAAAMVTDADISSSVALQRVDTVQGPGTHTYYFTAQSFSGAGNRAGRPKITAMYFPTNYGAIEIAAPAEQPLTFDEGSAVGGFSETNVRQFTAAEHNARLQADRAKQIADMEARIRVLEAQASNPNRLTERALETPRKER